MDRNSSVSFRNKGLLPDDLLKIILDYEPTSNYILSQEEKIRYEPKIEEILDVTKQLVLLRDTKGLEELFGQSQHHKTFLTTFFMMPQYYFDEVNEEVRESLSYIAKNSDKIRSLSSLGHFEKLAENLEDIPAFLISRSDRDLYLEFLQNINDNPYKNLIESELSLNLKFLRERFP